MRGTQFDSSHAALEEQLVRKYSRNRFVNVMGSKRRLSFEDVDEHPHQQFALRIYALRNGTHYHSMDSSPSWSYLDSAAKQALSVPVSKYVEAPEPIRLIEQQHRPSTMFKRRFQTPTVPPSTAPQEPTTSSGDDHPRFTPEQLEERRRRREQRRREEMDRQAKEQLFEEEGDDADAVADVDASTQAQTEGDDGESGGEGDGDDEDEEGVDDVIEL